MPDLGTISRFLGALGGLWDRAEQYLPLILGIALPLAGLVFTFSILQAFFQDGGKTISASCAASESRWRFLATIGVSS